MITKDEFLSKIFKYDVYKIDHLKDNYPDFHLPESKSLIYIKIPTNKIDLIKLFQSKGFSVVDVNIVFERLPLHVDRQIDKNLRICEFKWNIQRLY